MIPAQDGDRNLERRALHALRRGDRRRAPRGAAAPRARDRHGLTADVYGEGEADRTLGRVARRPRSRLVPRSSGRSATTSIHGERQGPKGFPRFTDPALRGPDALRGVPARRRRAEPRRRSASTASTFSSCTTRTAPATSRAAVWEGMAALRDAGLADAIGVAPGPANGFTLDLIACLERFGDVIDWAMVILNPLEPWPGELVLDAAAAAEVSRDHAGGRLRRAVLGRPGRRGPHCTSTTIAASGPRAGSSAGFERIERMQPMRAETGLTADAARLPVEPLPPRGRMRRADPDPGGRPEDARPIEDKRRELAGLPLDLRLRRDQVAAIARDRRQPRAR